VLILTDQILGRLELNMIFEIDYMVIDLYEMQILLLIHNGIHTLIDEYKIFKEVI
jgi:hypothetical protein